MAGCLLLGLATSFILRKGRLEDWGEGLLISLLGPPLFVLLVFLVLGEYVWHFLPIRSGRTARD